MTETDSKELYQAINESLSEVPALFRSFIEPSFFVNMMKKSFPEKFHSFPLGEILSELEKGLGNGKIRF